MVNKFNTKNMAYIVTTILNNLWLLLINWAEYFQPKKERKKKISCLAQQTWYNFLYTFI